MNKEKDIINILVIEDKEDYKKYISDLLQSQDIIGHVCVVDDEDKISSAIQEYYIDIILISGNLNNQVTSAICQNIFLKHGDTYPIIIISHESESRSVPFSVSESLTKGARDFLYLNDVFSVDNSQVVIKNKSVLMKKIIFWYNAISKNRIMLETISKEADNKKYKTLGNIDNYKQSDALFIGASTGGIRATISLLKELPDITVPVFIVQHLNKDFENNYCITLSRELNRNVILGKPDMCINGNEIIVFPASVGLLVKKHSKNIILEEYEITRGHRPRVSDVFMSALKAYVRPISVILTGLGSDGASALSSFHENGAPVLVQDPKDANAPSMNVEALDTGYVNFCGSIDKIAFWIDKITK